MQYFLQRSYFTAGRHVFRQVKGASMGSPCAPSLCGCVAAVQELLFRENYSSFLLSSRLFLSTFRYVDNRACRSVDPEVRPIPWQVYMSETFYGDSVLLEHVGDEPLLGFRIDTIQRSITVRMPVHASQFRSPLSADSVSFAMAGYRSRVLLICGFTRRRVHIVPQLEDLTQFYIQHGHTFRTLWSTLEKLLRQFKLCGQWYARAVHFTPVMQQDR